MSTDPFKNVKESWDWFQIQNLVAQNYDRTPTIGIGPSLRSPLLERVLINLLTINLASLLDEALETYASDRGIRISKDKLYDRIEALSAAGLIGNASELHKLRAARNDCAHLPAGFAGSGQPDWDGLNSFIKEVAIALRDSLAILDPPVKYEWFFERTPTIHDGGEIVLTQHYKFGVKRDGSEAWVFSTSLDFHSLGASSQSQLS